MITAQPMAWRLGKDGNLYGRLPQAGDNYNGAIFKVAPNGAVKMLYTFPSDTNGNAYNGGEPNDLTVGSDGNLMAPRNGEAKRRGHRVQNHDRRQVDHFIFVQWAVTAHIRMLAWCRAVTAISMAPPPTAITSSSYGTLFQITSKGHVDHFCIRSAGGSDGAYP